MNISGQSTISTFVDGIDTTSIHNLSQTADIQLTDNTINLVAPSVLVNGAPIGGGGGGIQNPLTSNLQIEDYDVIGPGLSLKNINSTQILQTSVIDDTANKVLNISNVVLDETTMIGKLKVDNINTNYVSSTSGDCTVNMFDNIIDINGTNLNFNSNPVISTPYSGEIEGASFKKTGGNSQQYLMADGSILSQSATSSNSNYYLYNSITTGTITPASGNISYNNAVQDNATIIYISHLSRDSIDIEIFIKQLTVLSDVYIQDQNVSENYIQYNINGVPILTVGENVAIPVIKRASSGTGSTNFPSGHQVILAFFTNSLEVDTRLSNLENTTALLTNNGTYTGFSGANGITTNKIVVSGKTSDDILLGNGSTTSLTTQTDRIAVVEQKTVNQTAINGVSTIFTGTSGVISTKFAKPTGGNPLHFWMTDGTTNSNTYALNSDLINTNSNINTLQSKTQNLTATTTTNTFTGTGGIICDKFVTNLGTSLGFVKGDGSLDTTGYTTLSTTNALVNLVNPLIVKTQNLTATTTTNTFTGTGGIICDKFIKTGGGLATEFLKSNGDFDSNTYIQSGSITNSAVPYINTIGKVSSAITNLYVQSGVNTIQSAIDAVVGGQAYSIQVSAGAFTENLVLSKLNYIVAGVRTSLFAPSTLITGNVTIGATGIPTTRIKLKDLLITGNLVFFSDATNQQLRTYVSNCEITGSITFPTLAVASTWIYFFDCSFSGSTAITIPNMSYGIVFTRCNFNGQAITSSVVSGALLTFRECTGMGTVTGLSTFYGMNATVAGISTSSASSLVLSGTATSLVKGNGTTLTGTSSQFVKGDASLDSTLYGGRKFSTISIVSLNGLQTGGNMIGTLNPSAGNVFAANEAKIGDVYTLKVYGTVFNPTTMSFTIGLLGSTYTFTSATLTVNVTATYVIDIMYTINSATSFAVTAFVNVYFTNTSIAQFGQNASYNTSGNIANSSTMTITYTNTTPTGSTFSVQQMMLTKM